VLIQIFSHLDHRDLCQSISSVCKKWSHLSNDEVLWRKFSVLNISKPKWCNSRLVSVEKTFRLIDTRFNYNITNVDLSKFCFTFELLTKLFSECERITVLTLNFRYFKYDLNVTKFAITYPRSLQRLYVKNVCDQKLRSSYYNAYQDYNSFEKEIIVFLKNLISANKHTLNTIGFKCVDPNVITQNLFDHLDNIEILLLNNISDTDSVLEELALKCCKLQNLELYKCDQFDGDGLNDIFESCEQLKSLYLGKLIQLNDSELGEIDWSCVENLQEFYIDFNNCSINFDFNLLFGSFKSLVYLALNNFYLSENEEGRVEAGETLGYVLPCALSNNEANLRCFTLRNKKITSFSQINCLSRNSGFLTRLSNFLKMQQHLTVLDLIGLNLKANFFVEIFKNLLNLRTLFIGHAKSKIALSELMSFDVDAIVETIAENCTEIVKIGIFVTQPELMYNQDSHNAIKNLLTNCTNLQELFFLDSPQSIATTHCKKSQMKYHELVASTSLKLNRANLVIKLCYAIDEAADAESHSTLYRHLHAVPDIQPTKFDFHKRFH